MENYLYSSEESEAGDLDELGSQSTETCCDSSNPCCTSSSGSAYSATICQAPGSPCVVQPEVQKKYGPCKGPPVATPMGHIATPMGHVATPMGPIATPMGATSEHHNMRPTLNSSRPLEGSSTTTYDTYGSSQPDDDGSNQQPRISASEVRGLNLGPPTPQADENKSKVSFYLKPTPVSEEPQSRSKINVVEETPFTSRKTYVTGGNGGTTPPPRYKLNYGEESASVVQNEPKKSVLSELRLQPEYEQKQEQEQTKNYTDKSDDNKGDSVEKSASSQQDLKKSSSDYNKDQSTTRSGRQPSSDSKFGQFSASQGCLDLASSEKVKSEPRPPQSSVAGVGGKNGRSEIVSNHYRDDPSCDPDHPVRVTFEEITSAAYKIKNGIVNTPCDKSHMSRLVDMDIYLKKDLLQHTGSFKERGARYAMQMLTEEQKQRGVIAASLGNHAQAVCYHGYLLGISVTVVMPIIAPIMKMQKCKEFQANVIMEGKDMGEARKIAIRLAQERGLTYINGYDHPQIIAGQGTIALEIIEQVRDIDAILVPTGGGGLLAGVCVAVKTLNPNIQVIAVESENCASYKRAMEAEKPVYTPIEGTLADGLAVPLVGYNAWETSKNLVDKCVVVQEKWIAVAILRMVEMEKCIVEGAGAVGLAAILAGQLDELKGKRVVLILSGGNIDTTILGRCLERGLAADGRLVKCKVTVSDRPGGISELCKLIGSIGVSIKDVIHERAWVASDVFSVEVKVVCETRDFAHSLELRDLLFSRYKKVKFDNLPSNLAASSSSNLTE